VVKHVDIVDHLSLNRNTCMFDGNFLGQSDMKRRSHRDGQGESTGVCGPILGEINPNAAAEKAEACHKHVYARPHFHV
jgi:hypothetical protein